MEKKKLFVSLPMHGRQMDDVLNEREAARKDAESIVGESLILLENYAKRPGITGRLECLGDSIMLMHQADIVYFVEGWNEHHGCRVEHEVCVEYGLDRIEPEHYYLNTPFHTALQLMQYGYCMTREAWVGTHKIDVYLDKESGMRRIICNLTNGGKMTWTPDTEDMLSCDWDVAQSDTRYASHQNLIRQLYRKDGKIWLKTTR